MSDSLPTDDHVQVAAVLHDGEVIAVPSGDMLAIYRVTVGHLTTGESYLEYEGLATLTGAHNTVRRWKP